MSIAFSSNPVFNTCAASVTSCVHTINHVFFNCCLHTLGSEISYPYPHYLEWIYILTKSYSGLGSIPKFSSFSSFPNFPIHWLMLISIVLTGISQEIDQFDPQIWHVAVSHILRHVRVSKQRVTSTPSKRRCWKRLNSLDLGNDNRLTGFWKLMMKFPYFEASRSKKSDLSIAYITSYPVIIFGSLLYRFMGGKKIFKREDRNIISQIICSIAYRWYKQWALTH